MCGELIDGKSVLKDVIAEVAHEALKLKSKPCLAVILVGNNPASEVYVKNKDASLIKAGFLSKVFRFSESVSEKEIISKIHELNEDASIDAFIVQLPLPAQINQKRVIEAISPLKDADGFTTTNLGNMFVDKKAILPATARGVMYLLEKSVGSVKGKNVVIIGASNIVGKPLAALLLNKLATVTICNIETKNLSEHTKRADILISAAGKAGLVTKEMVKEGVVVIDVGINQASDGSLCGDVAKDVVDFASKITPVPGGVGPVTIAMLLKNTLDCIKLRELTK